jgi:uncharacterized membrane protein YhhN
MIAPALIALSAPLVYWFYSDNGVISKISSIFLLIVATALQKTSYSKWAAFVMFICMIGDVFIELDHSDETDRSFLLGLVSFLIAHGGFVKVFYQPITRGGLATLPLVVGFYVYLMKRLYFKIEQEMRIPVLVYGLFICSMGFFAINRFFSRTSTFASRLCSLLGALIFVLSDTLLGIDRFDTSLQGAKFLVFVTYYIAMVFVTLSAVTDKEDATKAKSK